MSCADHTRREQKPPLSSAMLHSSPGPPLPLVAPRGRPQMRLWLQGLATWVPRVPHRRWGRWGLWAVVGAGGLGLTVLTVSAGEWQSRVTSLPRVPRTPQRPRPPPHQLGPGGPCSRPLGNGEVGRIAPATFTCAHTRTHTCAQALHTRTHAACSGLAMAGPLLSRRGWEVSRLPRRDCAMAGAACARTRDGLAKRHQHPEHAPITTGDPGRYTAGR